jgi:hypothetical protein
MNKETIQKALTEANHNLAGDDAAVTDITRLITNYENGKRPYYIYDSVTGAKLGMSQLPVFEKRLSAFGGDIVAMFASYKGRESKEVKTEAKVEVVEPVKTVPIEKVFQAAKREFVKVDKKPEEPKKPEAPKKPAGPKKTYEIATTKTDKDGNATEQTITITEGDMIVKREVRKIDPKDLVDVSEPVGAGH